MLVARCLNISTDVVARLAVPSRGTNAAEGVVCKTVQPMYVNTSSGTGAMIVNCSLTHPQGKARAMFKRKIANFAEKESHAPSWKGIRQTMLYAG